MPSKPIYHYVYRITNTVEKKHYYGKRSSKVEPYLDLGIKYFSSSSDKDFIIEQKERQEQSKSETCNFSREIFRLYHCYRE